MNTLIQIKASRENLISLLVFVPYIENSFLKHYLQFNSGDLFFASSLIIILFLALFFLAICLYSNKSIKSRFHNISVLLFVCLSFLSIFTSDYLNFDSSFSVWMWCCVPIGYAYVVTRYCRNVKVDYEKIIINMIIGFAFYVLVVLSYYIVIHHLFLDHSVRIDSRGGGAVIFGYTIAFFFALCMAHKWRITPILYYIVQIVFTVTAIGTGSRGAVWPILLMWVCNFIIYEKGIYRVLFVGIIIIAVLVTIVNDVSGPVSTDTDNLFSRLFNTNSSSRMLTSIYSLHYLFEKNIITILCGFGLGQFFPYHQWLLMVSDINSIAPPSNLIAREDFYILVQPHNSFVYTLLETGLISTIALIGSIALIAVGVIKNSAQIITPLIVIGVFIFVNCFDSILYVQPAVAGLLWLVLFLYYEEYAN